MERKSRFHDSDSRLSREEEDLSSFFLSCVDVYICWRRRCWSDDDEPTRSEWKNLKKFHYAPTLNGSHSSEWSSSDSEESPGISPIFQQQSSMKVLAWKLVCLWANINDDHLSDALFNFHWLSIAFLLTTWVETLCRLNAENSLTVWRLHDF